MAEHDTNDRGAIAVVRIVDTAVHGDFEPISEADAASIVS